LPVFRFSRAFGVGPKAKAFFDLQGGLTRGVVPDPGRHEERAQKLGKVTSRQKEALRRKDRRIEKQAAELEEQAAELQELREREQRRRARGLKEQRLEIFQLRNELEAAREALERAREDPSSAGTVGEPEVGALPDFVIIGAQKCGTTAFYRLLTRHPLVQPAAVRELHFFDRTDRLEKGTEWYRRCFPAPQWKNGRKTITGEKTPYYLFHPHVPQRMAEVVPRVRLIVLLRNPVDRAYSQYHHDMSMMQAKHRGKSRAFEETLEQQNSSYLPRGIYVDQLLRWSEYFGKEQMLILKSEDFFKHTTETLRTVQNFLDLPYCQLDLPPRETKERYSPMDPSTRRRLEAYFEPHNQRLYEYLGVDFGW
jgi:hypothetical protein